MSENNDAGSPSPESQVDVFSSCRSSRAGSEVPHRLREGRSLRSSPCITPRQGGGDKVVGFDDSVRSGRGGAYGGLSSNSRMRQYGGGVVNNNTSYLTTAGGGKANAKSLTNNRYLVNGNEMEMSPHHSVPFASGSYKLLQKLHYPSDVPGAVVKECGEFHIHSVEDDNAEYEATGELHAANCMESCDTRSVVRNDKQNKNSCISTMEIRMMPDPVHGPPVLSICVGDANGRVHYSELDMCSSRRANSSVSTLRKNKSDANLTSQSRADTERMSVSTSILSDLSFPYSDIVGFNRPPVRSHSHQAYVQEMDCLTSVTISQAVKSVRFLQCQESPNSVSYLTANERVIKLFRVQREGFTPFHAFPAMESVVGRRLVHSRYFPRSSPPSLILPVRVFSGCHSSAVQGLSVCSDGHSFLSADDLQVFWWNLESGDSSKGMCVTDCRSTTGCMDEVVELVTSVAFSPSHSSIFLVSKTSGLVGVGDLRKPVSGSQCHYATSIHVTGDSSSCKQEQYSDILCSVSAAEFLGPQHVVTRDYLSLRLWDLRRSDISYAVAPVMKYVEPYLDSLYENDCIFDRFPLVVDHISGTVLTGLYDTAASVWQPLQEGRIPDEDVLVHYRVDPQSLLCEVENGGRTTVGELSASLENKWTTLAPRMADETTLPVELPEPIAKKVSSVSIADGGERFALASVDGRCFFVFERKSGCRAS